MRWGGWLAVLFGALLFLVTTMGLIDPLDAFSTDESNQSALQRPAVAPAQSGPIRIMPLGDSITEASSGFGSYRYYLWRELAREGFAVDFVGSMTGTGGEASAAAEFDSDHEGHPGWRADEVAARIEDWARTARPDLVLLHLGTNDLAQRQPPSDVIQDLTTIVDRLRVVNPHIHILLAQIIPMRTDGPPDVLELNEAISALAAATSIVASPVECVDQFTGFDQAGMTWDGIHPNREGNKRIATIWREALLPHLRVMRQATR
jgi:lysophospholipase L1-like esterase